MTVQAGIETVTDLEVLVGEFEELACEHSRHGKDAHWHEDQPASHYVQARCACTGEQWTNAYAACPRFVAQISRNVKSCCNTCGHIDLLTNIFRILAPITR